MPYTVLIAPMAERQLRKLPRDVLRRVDRTIRALALDPRPAGAKALKGRPWFRVRAGDYRIVYEPRDRALIVLVVKIPAPRRIARTVPSGRSPG